MLRDKSPTTDKELREPGAPPDTEDLGSWAEKPEGTGAGTKHSICGTQIQTITV